jgi:outer membrane protein
VPSPLWHEFTPNRGYATVLERQASDVNHCHILQVEKDVSGILRKRQALCARVYCQDSNRHFGRKRQVVGSYDLSPLCTGFDYYGRFAGFILRRYGLMTFLRSATRKLSVALTGAMTVVTLFAPGNTHAAGRKLSTEQRSIRLNLPQAVEIALRNNLSIVDAQIAVRESEYQRRQAYSDMFPTLSLEYSATGYRYKQGSNVSNLATAHASRRDSSQYPYPDYPYRIDPYRAHNLSATLSQPIYSGGKLVANYKYAKLGVDYSNVQLEIDKQDLILKVYEAYYSLLKQELLVDVANQSIKALKSLRDQTRKYYKAGTVAKVDLLSTEGDLASAIIDRTDALTEVGRYKAQLNLYLGFPQETNIEIERDLNIVTQPLAPPAIYRIAAANRLEIRRSNISVEKAMELIKAARADLIPAITLQVQASRSNDDWNVLDPEGTNEWSITGLVSWDFNMFRNKDTVLEKRASRDRTVVQETQLVREIMEAVKEAYLDLKRAESNIRDYRKAVEYRKESFRINEVQYREHTATYTEVLDAQRYLAKAQGSYYSALVNYKLNSAILDRRMGTLK